MADFPYPVNDDMSVLDPTGSYSVPAGTPPYVAAPGQRFDPKKLVASVLQNFVFSMAQGAAAQANAPAGRGNRAGFAAAMAAPFQLHQLQEQQRQQELDRQLKMAEFRRQVQQGQTQQALQTLGAVQGSVAPQVTVQAPEATSMSYPGQIGPGPTFGGGSITVAGQLPPVTIPGYGPVQPQSAQDMARLAAEAAERKARLDVQTKASEPYNLAPGATRYLGSTPIATNPKGDEATGDFGKYYLPAFAMQNGVNVAGKDPGAIIQALGPQKVIEAINGYAQRSQDPEMKAQMESLRNAELALKQLQLSQQPTAEQAQQVADDLVKHRIAPEQMSQMFGGFGPAGQNFKRMVYSEAKKLDPEFDFERAAAEYGLVKSPSFQTTVRYMDSVQNSIPQVIAAANTLANGQVRSINSLLNAGKGQFNNVDLKKFQTDRLFVADEIAKILAGGGTGSTTSDSKLTQASAVLKDNDSPQAIAAALGEVKGLIGTRRQALTKGTYLEGQFNSADRIRVRGPNGQTGTIPAGSALPAGWAEVK